MAYSYGNLILQAEQLKLNALYIPKATEQTFCIISLLQPYIKQCNCLPGTMLFCHTAIIGGVTLGIFVPSFGMRNGKAFYEIH